MTDKANVTLLRLAWQQCREAQQELRLQLRTLEAQERELASTLAPLLCGIPVGSVVEIPYPTYNHGRWRITGFTITPHARVELQATKVLKDGSDSTHRHTRLLDVDKRMVISKPTESSS